LKNSFRPGAPKITSRQDALLTAFSIFNTFSVIKSGDILRDSGLKKSFSTATAHSVSVRFFFAFWGEQKAQTYDIRFSRQ
jgi:hypothetical protein